MNARDKELRFLAKWAQEEAETQCWQFPAHQLQVQHALPSVEVIKRIRMRLDEAKMPDGELAPKNRTWMRKFKARWKERLQQLGIWLVSHRIEVE